MRATPESLLLASTTTLLVGSSDALNQELREQRKCRRLDSSQSDFIDASRAGANPVQVPSPVRVRVAESVTSRPD